MAAYSSVGLGVGVPRANLPAKEEEEAEEEMKREARRRKQQMQHEHSDCLQFVCAALHALQLLMMTAEAVGAVLLMLVLTQSLTH